MAFPGTTWATKTPAQAGLSKAKLDAFKAAVVAKNIHISRNGYQVYTLNAAGRFEWASAVKPVYTTMLFAARKKGLIDVVSDALISDAMPAWELTEQDQGMRFHHVANMISGYTLPEGPGEAWAYNDYGISVYKVALFQGVYGVPPSGADGVVRNFLKPLQFQDGKILGARGGYGMLTSCRDFARIGLLWLNKGKWKTSQLLGPGYFDNYCKVHVPADMPRSSGPDEGGKDVDLPSDYLGLGTTGGTNNQPFVGQGRYGYTWWHNPGGVSWPSAPDDAFGAIGHFNAESMVIIPSWGIVAAWRGRNSTPATQLSDMNRYLTTLGQAIQ